MSEKRTKILFKELFSNLAIRFNIIIVNREKRVKKGPGIALLLLADLLS